MEEKSICGRISIFALILAACPQKCRDSTAEDLPTDHRAVDGRCVRVTWDEREGKKRWINRFVLSSFKSVGFFEYPLKEVLD